jgi:CO/xanthine dehydrogenase Mo-binding subunit
MMKKQFSVIGKPLRKVDAMAKCAGETVYADDLNLPRMIYAKLLQSILTRGCSASMPYAR